MGNNEPLEVVYSTKLLGVICSSNAKWEENTTYITKRATKKLWMLQRLKWIGADQEILLETYKLHVRTILEECVPLWHSSLTIKDSNRLEKVQKMAFSIILNNYNSYTKSLNILKEETLKSRRKILCLKFAKNCVKNPKHSNMFPQSSGPQTRNKNTFQEYKYRTDRFFKSALPYLIRLLNQNY